MQTSVIRVRVADFLKQHPPFDALSELDLLALASSGRVKFHESEELIHEQGAPKGRFVWVIQQGRVELLDGEQLRDVVGEGDLLGTDRFFGDGVCRLTARTATDVILYSVEGAMFEEVVARYPSVKRHLAAHFSISATDTLGRASWLDAEPPPLAFLQARRAPPSSVTLDAPLSTRSALRAMLNAGVDSVNLPDGPTVTAADLALFCGRDAIRLVDEIRDAGSSAEQAPLVQLAVRLVRDALAQPQDVDDCALLTTHLVDARSAASGLRFGTAARTDWLDPAFAAPAPPERSLDEWKQFYSDTIRDPIGSGIYSRREFFDLRHCPAELRAHILEELERETPFIPVLANDTLTHLPPLTFYQDVVIDLDGRHRKTFDIGASAVTPIVDAARVFALSHRRLEPASTLERLAAAAEDHPEHRAIFIEAADAFRVALYHQALAGGAAVAPSRLTRYDQRLLKTSFLSMQRLLELAASTFL